MEPLTLDPTILFRLLTVAHDHSHVVDAIMGYQDACLARDASRKSWHAFLDEVLEHQRFSVARYGVQLLPYLETEAQLQKFFGMVRDKLFFAAPNSSEAFAFNLIFDVASKKPHLLWWLGTCTDHGIETARFEAVR